MNQIDRYARKQKWISRGKDPVSGRPFCHCGCGQIVMPPRRTAASEECVRRHQNHSDATTIRLKVLERDKGVCALCGTDTNELLRIIRETESLWRWLARREGEDRMKRGESLRDDLAKPVAWGEVYDFTQRHIREQIVERGWHHFDDHAWEADHIVPVAEGGGGCDFTGYRTLCIPCHKRQTALLAARLAEKRRAAKKTETPILILQPEPATAETISR